MFDLLTALLKGNPDTLNGRQAAYFSECLSADIAMFRYSINGEYRMTDKDGKTLDGSWVERYLNTSGCIASEVKNGLIKIAPVPSRTGDLNQYGDGTDAFGVTRDGIQIQGVIGEDVFLCYNQSSRMADLDLLYYPDLLAKCDEAIEACLKWSKPAPVIAASDAKAQKTINDMLEQIMNGTPAVVVDGEVLTRMRQGTSYTIDVTSPERVRNVQYISELIDEAVKRFYTKRGIDTHRTAKHAQVTTAESDGMQVYSWVHPLDKLRCRQQWCDDQNAKHPDLQITVEFNEPWLSAYNAFMRSMAEPDETEVNENGAYIDNPDENDSGRSEDSGNGSDD